MSEMYMEREEREQILAELLAESLAERDYEPSPYDGTYSEE